jgi:hypothetical protein
MFRRAGVANRSSAITVATILVERCKVLAKRISDCAAIAREKSLLLINPPERADRPPNLLQTLISAVINFRMQCYCFFRVPVA